MKPAARKKLARRLGKGALPLEGVGRSGAVNRDESVAAAR